MSGNLSHVESADKSRNWEILETYGVCTIQSHTTDSVGRVRECTQVPEPPGCWISVICKTKHQRIN